MAREYRYISGDSHLEIDSKRWVDRVPAQHRARAPRLIRLPDGGDAWLIEGRPLREVPSDLYGGRGCGGSCWAPTRAAAATPPPRTTASGRRRSTCKCRLRSTSS